MTDSPAAHLLSSVVQTEADVPEYAEYAIVLLDSKPHGGECQRLCGSELTSKIKHLAVEGARAPVFRSWRRQWRQNYADKCRSQCEATMWECDVKTWNRLS